MTNPTDDGQTAAPLCGERHPDFNLCCVLPADHLSVEPAGFHSSITGELTSPGARWRDVQPLYRLGERAACGFRINGRVDVPGCAR